MKIFKSNAKKIRGQGMSEYLIIVALIAVAGIAVMGLFGNTARNQVAGLAQELAGGDGTASMQTADTDSQAAATEGNTKRSLSSYSNANAAITGN